MKKQTLDLSVYGDNRSIDSLVYRVPGARLNNFMHNYRLYFSRDFFACGLKGWIRFDFGNGNLRVSINGPGLLGQYEFRLEKVPLKLDYRSRDCREPELRKTVQDLYREMLDLIDLTVGHEELHTDVDAELMFVV